MKLLKNCEKLTITPLSLSYSEGKRLGKNLTRCLLLYWLGTYMPKSSYVRTYFMFYQCFVTAKANPPAVQNGSDCLWNLLQQDVEHGQLRGRKCNHPGPETHVSSFPAITFSYGLPWKGCNSKHLCNSLSRLDRFEKTNEMLINFNGLSNVRLQQMNDRFLLHTRTLIEMKKDLDSVFRRIRCCEHKLLSFCLA